MAPPEWDYGANGPNEWHKKHPAASGTRQSPIDIITAKTKYDATLRPLVVDYDPYDDFRAVNNGRSVTITRDNMKGHNLSGGPLADHRYRFEQFHFHWGASSAEGSEHLVDGKSYPAELHLVHWNTDLYKSFGEAATSEKGLAVLGFFIEIGDQLNRGLTAVADFLPQVEKTGDVKPLKMPFNLSSLLGDNIRDYWTYDGSLTTPPCAESVTWFVFKDPICATEAQMNHFRSLQASSTSTIVNNYRPVLPVHNRLVRSTFK